MKTIITTIALSILSLIAIAQETIVTSTTKTVTEVVDKTGTTITVNVPVANDAGSVFFSLQTKDNFLKGGDANLESKIIDGKATAVFENVTPGDYAITVYWDKNGNKQMDFQPNGMPKEMYGISNNVMNFGPPQWSDAVFTVGAEPLVLEIRL